MNAHTGTEPPGPIGLVPIDQRPAQEDIPTLLVVSLVLAAFLLMAIGLQWAFRVRR